MLSAGTRSRVRAGSVTIAVAIASAAVLGLAPSDATAAPLGATTASPAAEREAGPSLVLAPSDPLIDEGEGLDIEVTVRNPAATPLAHADVGVQLTTQPIATRYALSGWLTGTPQGALSTIGTVQIPDVPAFGSRTVRLEIEPDALPFGAEAAWGTYGLAASLPTAAAPATSLVVVDAPPEGASTRLALAAPIAAELGSEPLLTAGQLETATGEGGRLTELLSAAERAGVSVGIDPAIGASVAALGDEAPESARNWLDDATALDATYPLQYANADPVATLQAGAYPLRTIGIPADGEDPLPPSTGVIGDADPVIDASATPLTAAEIAGLDGQATVVLDASFLDEVLEGATPNAHVSIDGHPAIATDAELLRTLRDAANAQQETEAADARARAVGLLATVTRERPSDQRTLASVLPASGPGTAALLEVLDDASFVELAEIGAALESPAREVSLAPQQSADSGAELVRTALTEESEAARVLEIVGDAAPRAADLRLRVLQSIPDAGTVPTQEDRAAVEALGESIRALRQGVQVLDGSTIQVVGTNVGLPVTIVNSLDTEVSVQLSVRASNALVTIPDPRVDVVLPAGSQQRVQVPAEIVGTGRVVIIAELRTPSGAPLGQVATLQASTQPTVEALLGWIVGGSSVLLIGFGIFRSIRKRKTGQARGDLDERKERPSADDAAAHDEHDGEDRV